MARAQGLPPAGAAALLAAAESAHQLTGPDGRAHLHCSSLPMPFTFAACADYAPSTSEGFAAYLTWQCVALCLVPDRNDLYAGARHQQPLVRLQHGFKTSAGAPSSTACSVVVHLWPPGAAAQNWHR